MNWFEDLIHLSMVILFLVIYLLRNKIETILRNKPQKVFWKEIRQSCKVKYNSFGKSILLPIVLIVLYWWYIVGVMGVNFAPRELSFMYRLSAVTFTPIFEEVLFRGIYLSIMFIYLPKLLLKKKYPKYKLQFILLGVLLVSMGFSFLHEFKLDLRYITGVIFAVVYLIDEQNLLPAFIAHALNNFIALYISSSFF